MIGRNLLVLVSVFVAFGTLSPGAMGYTKGSGTPEYLSHDSDPITEALHRAENYWHNAPCDGQIAIVSDPAPNIVSPIPGTFLSMWVSFNTPRGYNNFAESPITYTGCVVHLNQMAWPNWRADDSSFTIFCQIMTHELGHFEGYSDVGAVPDTIQYENPMTAPIVSPCQHYRLVYVVNHNMVEVTSHV